MITLATFGLMRCCPDQGCGWDKAANIVDSDLPWVDLAIGVILNIIGNLALYGAYTLPGYQWIIAAGSLQLVLTLFMKWRKCCMTCKNICSSYTNPDTKKEIERLLEIKSESSASDKTSSDASSSFSDSES